jgi:hypothetical protein
MHESGGFFILFFDIMKAAFVLVSERGVFERKNYEKGKKNEITDNCIE